MGQASTPPAVGQSLLSQSNLSSGLPQSHLNMPGSSSPVSLQNNLNPSSQNLFKQSGINIIGQSGFNSLANQMGGSQLFHMGQSNVAQMNFGPTTSQGSNQSFMGKAEQSSNVNHASENQFPKEIEEEANSYFQEIIIKKTIPINQALEMLKKFKNSADERERAIFECMLQALFEEYKFFYQYPERELNVMGKLFGGIIERTLVTYVPLGYALRFILESLKYPTSHKLYMFGINALEEFKHKLKDYPQYCRYLKEKIPHYKEFPPRLLEYIEHGEDSQEPPLKQQPHPFSSLAPHQGTFNTTSQLQQNTPIPNQSQYSLQSMFGNNQSGHSFSGIFGQNSGS